MPGTATGVTPFIAGRRRKGHHPHSVGKQGPGLGFGRIQPVCRKRPVGHIGIIVARFLPRPVEILNLRKSRGDRGIRLMVEDQPPVPAIVSQQRELFMEQRKPVLHSGMHASRGDRVVQRVAAGQRPESRPIAGTEPLYGCLVQLEFRDRTENQPVLRPAATLRRRVEIANGLQLVAEEIQPYRGTAPGRKDIQNAAPKRKFAGFTNSVGAKIALPDEKIAQPRRTCRVAGRQHERPLGKIGLRRHTLQQRIHGGENDRAAAITRLRLGKPCQCFDPLADQGALRRQTVIGKAVPGREQMGLCARHQARQPVPHRHHARIVPRHIDKARATAEPAGQGQHANPVRNTPDRFFNLYFFN